MAASNLPVTQSSVPTQHSRSEQTGVNGGDGKPIIAQVVLAGAHKRNTISVQSLTLTGATQSLTVPAGTPATLADIYAEGVTTSDFCRYWHGASPSATVGKRLRDHEELQSADPANFQAINGSGTITLRVEYYSYP